MTNFNENDFLNIVHVIGTLDPRCGGPPQVCAALAATQVRHGHRVAVVTENETAREILDEEYAAKCPGFERVAVHCSPVKLSIFGAGRLCRFSSEVIDKADVVHAHGFWELVLVAAAKRVRRRKGVFVVRPAGMLDPWSLSQRGLKKKIAMALTHRELLHGRGFIHALTGAEVEHTLRLNGTRLPVEIPNGVSEAMLEASRNRPRGAYRRVLPVLGDDPFVLFLGRIHYKKGLDRLAEGFLRLAQRHPTVRLVVAGQEEGAGPEARAILGDADVSKRVHWVGPLYGEAKQAAMQDAVCFTLPSRQEGFSVAVLEAMAVACPVVITPECHFDSLVDFGAGQIVAGEAVPLADAWLKYLESDQLRAESGMAAQRLVATQYTWDVIARRLETEYGRSLSES